MHGGCNFPATAMEFVELQPDSNNSEGSPLENQIVRAELNFEYNHFYWQFMDRNVPIVLTSVSNNWECRRNWTFTPNGSDDGKRAINFDFLRKTLENCIVPIADCNLEYFNSHAKLEMRFHDFLDHWMATIQRSDEENSNACDSKNLYLKDWHLKAQMPDYDFYCVPKHFASDFLNEFLVANDRDDYRFVYMGPKGTWTPFHADVFGSYSWSTNIIGCKKWLLVPPGEELKLMSRRGNLPFEIDEALLEAKGVRYYTLMQQENESIFVPSGWYHQVTNLSDTISVNHNFFNACNLMRIWENLAIGMRQVIAEIEDCRQMDNFSEHCQTMLRASFGINYLDFLDMLSFLVKRRRRSSCNENGNQELSSDNNKRLHKYVFNSFHKRHDLQSIKSVLEAMIDDTVVRNSRGELTQRCINLLESIRKDLNQLA